MTAFFCFMFSWVELLLARTLTTVDAKPIAATMTRTVSAPPGMDWGVLAAAGVLTIVPGALVIWFVRNYIAKGFALGPGLRRDRMDVRVDGLDLADGGVLRCIALMLARHDRLGAGLADRWRAGASCRSRPPAATGCSSGCWAPPTSIWPGSA